MGLMDKRRELLDAKEAQAETKATLDANPEQRWDYLALNLKKVAGPLLESALNEHGARGFEAVCVADGYLVLKRPIPA